MSTMNKISEANSYEELEDFCKKKKYSVSDIYTKRSWFEANNLKGKYNNLLTWIGEYLVTHNAKQKISPELAKSYKDAYGATQAVIKLEQHFGIKLSRQGLYAAANKLKGQRRILPYYLVTQTHDILEHMYIDYLCPKEREYLNNRVDWWGDQGYSCQAMDKSTYDSLNQHHEVYYLKRLYKTLSEIVPSVRIDEDWQEFINKPEGSSEFLLEDTKLTLLIEEEVEQIEEGTIPEGDMVLGLSYRDFFTRLKEYGTLLFDEKVGYSLEPEEVTVSLLEVNVDKVKICLLGYEDEFVLTVPVSDIVTKYLIGTILVRENLDSKLEEGEGFCTDSRKYLEKWKNIFKDVDTEYYTII